MIIDRTKTVFFKEAKEKWATEPGHQNKEFACRNVEIDIGVEITNLHNQPGFLHNKQVKSAAELVIVYEELVSQIKETEKRTTELIAANRELILLNKEKELEVTRLKIANAELAIQHEAKEKQAAELIIAIRDLKISEDETKDVNKELEAFSYSVSHDLRAPLRAINGYTRMLKESCDNDLSPEANRLINNIGHYAKKMGQLIDDLLTFSRVGRRDLTKMDISMNKVVNNLCQECKHEHTGNKIEFHIELLSPALADNMAIKQVWLNLISNAIKYSRSKETAIIEIGCIENDKEIIYFIKDNGAGFDMRYAGKLYGVFQRLHSDEEFEGTGVGLALVHRLINKHGGRVWAEGKVNSGATFYFTLPKP